MVSLNRKSVVDITKYGLFLICYGVSLFNFFKIFMLSRYLMWETYVPVSKVLL
jgi:hypothetical protein